MTNTLPAIVPCPVCGESSPLLTFVAHSARTSGYPQSTTCPTCESCIRACWKEGEAMHWSVRAYGVSYVPKLLDAFADAVLGVADATHPFDEGGVRAKQLRDRLVATTLSAAVAGAMNGAENRLALAMRAANLVREAPEVPDPPACFTPRFGVSEMARQVLVYVKSVVAIENAQRSTQA